MKLLKLNKLINFFILLLVLLTVGCTSTEKKQTDSTIDHDIVVVANANILTMNSNQPTASAMAFKDGKILAIGDLATVKKAAGSSYEYHDLEGKTVVPGFIESHDHIVQYGGALEYLDITPFTCPTLKEALQKLKAQGKPNEDGWIYAWAVDQTLYEEKRGPTIQELDELFPDIPVFIFHMSGHGGFANSKAFELAGVTKDTPDPVGGIIEKDETGELSGYLNGMPAWMLVGKMPAITYESTLNSAKYHARHGFTTATEFALMNSNMLKLLEESTKQPGFPVRIYGGMFITIPGLNEIAPQIKNYETELFKVPYIKTWTDGSTQGGTGYFTEPFHKLEVDTKDGARGSQEQFNEELTTMLNLGFAPGIHANGDAAMDLALNAIEYARNKTGRIDIRPHLIHCQYVRDDQFDRIQKMGNIGMTFFTPHVYFWGDMHRDVLIGPERAAQVSSMNKAIDRNIPYAIHNDPPVNNPNAIHSMWVAVNRLTSSGKELGLDQRITSEQALMAYTSEAAKVLGLEDEIGSLEPGKYADFVVLSENPLEVEPIKLKNIQVLTTVMNGRITYQVALHGLYHHH